VADFHFRPPERVGGAKYARFPLATDPKIFE